MFFVNRAYVVYTFKYLDLLGDQYFCIEGVFPE